MQLLLVDDHRLFSEGLTVLLKELEPSIYITSAHSVAQASVETGKFDLILLDLHLPDAVGYDGIERLKMVYEGTPIVVLSGEESSSCIRDCINFGAMGFVSKSSSTTDLLIALKRILNGEIYLPVHVMFITSDIAGATRRSKSDLSAHLTNRQLEVLAKVIQGKPNKIIARELEISDTTVKTHVVAVLAALGVSNRTEAVYKAAMMGWNLKKTDLLPI